MTDNLEQDYLKNLCHSCVHFDKPYCWKLRSNVEKNPELFYEKCNGELFSKTKTTSSNNEPFAITALKIFAWINLIAGIITAFAIWKTDGNILFSFVAFISGIFGWTFFLVICLIAENTIAIRKNTDREKTE